MPQRDRIAAVLAAVLIASFPAPLHASPDIPMCVAERTPGEMTPISLVHWHAPMCGPYVNVFAISDPRTLEARAIEAYREATEQIVAANYQEARLLLDLAHQGLPQISDRIALQSARLELLRGQPGRAAEFFAEASQSPHESVRLEASSGRVLALLRANDPAADEALHELLELYPATPDRIALLFEHAQSLLRQARNEEAIAALHAIRVDEPGSRIAPWAASELVRLSALGFETPTMTGEERVRQLRNLMRTGPLDKARALISELIDSPLTGEQLAQVHYFAGRLARDEGRWKLAEAYMRSAQSFPSEDPTIARHIANRAEALAETVGAREADLALQQLARLRAGRRNVAIPSSRLVDMIRVAAPPGLRTEVDGILATLSTRTGVPSDILFDAAMAAIGAAREDRVIALLEEVAKRPTSAYRTAAIYHLGRAHERAQRPTEAALFFMQAKASAELSGDHYYALWAENGLGRVERGERDTGEEGLSNSQAPMVRPPRASDRALAEQLQPIGEVRADSYPWIARAAVLLRAGDRDAATAELFETYLTWRQALGRPIASAGLNCVARIDGRVHPPMTNELRSARLELSEDDRATLATVAAALGDTGTAGGFAGAELIDTLPRAYEWLAVPAANRYGLDPNVLLAVMRVESVYQKHIVSYAGAVGLMQIMPRTGQLIARALGHDDFTPADLLDPGLNLEFAAWYLSSLIHRFDGRLPLAIAAYNGGPHNVRRWIQESADGTPLDVLLERIPFTQTHRYVRKVLVNYEAYRQQRALPMPQLSLQLPAQRVDPLAF